LREGFKIVNEGFYVLPGNLPQEFPGKEGNPVFLNRPGLFPAIPPVYAVVFPEFFFDVGGVVVVPEVDEKIREIPVLPGSGQNRLFEDAPVLQLADDEVHILRG
jgi:hypothetical protein